MKKKVIIDIVSDIICPWCYIGKSRLERAIAQVSDHLEVETRLRPFQLYPKVPVGGLPKEDFPATRKPGLGKALKEAAATEKLTFNYKKIKVIPNTLEAHRLMHLATENETRNRLGMALFEAYFENAEDVEDPLVLARIARDAGVPKEQIDAFLHTDAGKNDVQNEIQDLKADGVSAVPSFIVNEDILVMGVQPIEKWLRFFDRIKNS